MPLILIVDDDEDIRFMLRRLLEGRGWTVDEAVDGEKAREVIKDKEYDVILLDHTMPGISGYELAKELRANHYIKPIIFYSAYITDELENKLNTEVNIDLHVIHKTDFSRLLRLVSDLFDQVEKK